MLSKKAQAQGFCPNDSGEIISNTGRVKSGEQNVQNTLR